MKVLTMSQHCVDGSANPDWLDARAGLFTGSDFHQYMPLLKTGKLSETAKKSLYKKVLENYGYRFNTFQTPEMLIGIEREPTAREAYSFIYGKQVEEVGFVDLEKYHAGCSPDGVIYGVDMVETEPRTITMVNKKTGKTTDIIDDIGYKKRITEIIEIKCPSVETFVSYLDDEFMKPEYETQMQFNMFVTGADVCHFVVYHPDFNLIVRDVEKNPEIQDKIKKVLEELSVWYDDLDGKVREKRLETEC